MKNYFQSKAGDQSKKDKTKAAIIDSAIKVISKKGYERSSIQEVAKKAGIANGTFYNHYKDRKSIFEEIANLIAFELVKSIEEDEIHTKNPVHKLINSTSQFINRSVQIPEWGTIFIEASDFTVHYEKSISKYLIKDIRSGINKKFFKVKYDVFLIDQIMVLILHSISAQLKKGRNEKTTKKTINAILQLLNYNQ
jgi:AcrR family transcriptional regulator